MNEIFVNDLIQWRSRSGASGSSDNADNPLIERVVWIDERYVTAFVLNIHTTKGFPQSHSIDDLKEALKHEEAIKVDVDPWEMVMLIQEDRLSSKEKELRDNAWEIIEALVTQEPDIYYRHLRGKLIRAAIDLYSLVHEGEELAEKVVYKHLRRFWQRGKVKNALLPDYVNSGGKGKERKAGSKKRGRPRKYKNHPEIGEGINITEQDRQTFRTALNQFYLNPTQNTFQKAYELMIKQYYKEEIYFDENHVKKSILMPAEKLPTLSQFRYWYETESRDLRHEITTRRGAKCFALEHRAILGTSLQETIGPGSRYQIDATIADVYLVSTYQRNWIIGRPVIYVIIDVFSRMVVGVYVGLEGPSWLGAMMALSNVATDKVSFCQEFGISITEEQWPCYHIPESILGDRGELAGMSVETMIPNLDIRIENAAPYRADWKGLVERHFKTIHGHVKPFLPGYINTDFRERGGRDYRLDARLDLKQFTEIIIKIILHHNSHLLKTYNRDQEMIKDKVEPIPLELWKWGIMNRSGKLRTINEDIIKLNLMPRGKAKITPRGIQFKSMYYTCEKAVKEKWFIKARSDMLSRDEKYLQISYDPRKMDFIYLPSVGGRDFEKCFLLDPDERYSNKTIYDVEYLLEYEELQKKKNQAQALQNIADLTAEIENIVLTAEQETEKYQDKTESNRQKTSNIRENRANEKAERRKIEAFELKPDSNPSPVQNTEKSTQEFLESNSSPKSTQPDHLNLLAQKRKERKGGG